MNVQAYLSYEKPNTLIQNNELTALYTSSGKQNLFITLFFTRLTQFCLEFWHD
jgi:hypothetical protein